MYDVKTFTVEEANKLIPVLTPLLYQLEEMHTRLLGLQAQVDALELISENGVEENSPNGEDAERLVIQMKTLADSYQVLVDKVQAYGCYLKGVFPTLIDFFHTHKGNVVYLCWMLGETEINHWHAVGSGFSNRQTLSSLDQTA